jgi:DNA end-binding protein Ku
MPRALWRGAISFGLVYVPVELHTASRENTLPLHMLDSRDFSPVGYQRINKRTGKEVDWSHIVKGYEYKKGNYVVLTDADFKHANVKASETIEVETFCDAVDIPYLYYEKPYYLIPAKGGAKVYSLLRQALSASGKVAVATFVMHQRQHLCAVSPSDSSLTLLTLRFPDEIVPLAEKQAPSARVTATELSMAKQLVQHMSGKFVPSHFKDTYRSDLRRRIQEKIRKKEQHSLDVEPPSAERTKAEVIDLMAALKASLGKNKARPRSHSTQRDSRRKRA